jgi:hypothetical protein
MTFDQALAAYLGAAAPAGELTRLSDTLGRVRRHLITVDRVNTQRGR